MSAVSESRSVEQRVTDIVSTATSTDSGIKLDLRIYLYPERVGARGQEVGANSRVVALVPGANGELVLSAEASTGAYDDFKLVEELAMILGRLRRRVDREHAAK